jgi:putative transposase
MSYSNLHLHIVYATKNRSRALDHSTIERLVKYTGGIIRNQGGILLHGNGVEDHVHLLVTMPTSLPVSELVRTVKTNSSRWLHETSPDQKEFAWQDGYSAFSVSHSAIPQVTSYIQGQQEHHKRMSFKDELRALLDRHEIEYDERYL